MTVADLIAALAEMPQDAHVMLSVGVATPEGRDGSIVDIARILPETDGQTVYVEGDI